MIPICIFRGNTQIRHLLGNALSNSELIIIFAIKFIICILLLLYKRYLNVTKSLQDLYYSNMPPYYYVLYVMIAMNTVPFLMTCKKYFGDKFAIDWFKDMHLLIIFTGQYWIIRPLFYYNRQLSFRFSDLYTRKLFTNFVISCWCCITLALCNWKAMYRRMSLLHDVEHSPKRL